MAALARAPVMAVLQQHCEDAASLRSTRRSLVRAPHVKLHQLRRLDDRIAAHLDGLAVAGPHGSRLAESALASPGIGEVFVATVRAIEDRDSDALARLLALAQAEPGVQAAHVSAFGWVSAPLLRGITRELLTSAEPFVRGVGLAACRLHRVDPGEVLAAALRDDNAALRARALRAAGELGRVNLLPACLAALNDDDEHCRSDALHASLLLGDRSRALEKLSESCAAPGTRRGGALRLWLMLAPTEQARAVLARLAAAPDDARLLLGGVAAAGDTHYVPWLIRQMNDPRLARLAGEVFSEITGADLALLDLDMNPAPQSDTGPNDDPGDDDVTMDEDEGLPWPDAARVTAWWQVHGARMPAGVRHFMGKPPGLEHCAAVLREGFQRQRLVAARWLRLLAPGRPLFNVAVPAWRQQRLLASGLD